MNGVLIFAGLLIISGIVLFLHFTFRRKINIWLPSYVKRILINRIRPSKAKPPFHILFCFVDHFEPGWNKADAVLQRQRVDGWVEKYPVVARQFKDADGYHPRHTWFYPPHYYKDEHLEKLTSLCISGFGEIELHLHHNRMEPFPDTPKTLRDKIERAIVTYSKYGIFKTIIDGQKKIRYAFIHGDWALANSRDGYCGVNDEIAILKDTGCYADFTFPSYMVESQPSSPNTVYYATSNPSRPKSYDAGSPVRVGGGNEGDLMIVQGPLGFRWRGRKRRFFPSVDDGEIAGNNPPTKARVDYWIKTAIHIVGKPEWIIVKVFTHGAALRGHDVLLGEPIMKMHSYLREQYNDGRNFCLHYVTARELYNIIKAAEAGRTGNPSDYRNYLIKPYEYHINNEHTISSQNSG
jgi:hypothetical protein